MVQRLGRLHEHIGKIWCEVWEDYGEDERKLMCYVREICSGGVWKMLVQGNGFNLVREGRIMMVQTSGKIVVRGYKYKEVRTTNNNKVRGFGTFFVEKFVYFDEIV